MGFVFSKDADALNETLSADSACCQFSNIAWWCQLKTFHAVATISFIKPKTLFQYLEKFFFNELNLASAGNLISNKW